MQALGAYKRHLAQTNNNDTAGLLLRVNSVAHLRAVLPALVERARSKYAAMLQHFQMPGEHLAALDDAMESEANVSYLSARQHVCLLCSDKGDPCTMHCNLSLHRQLCVQAYAPPAGGALRLAKLL